MCRATFRRFYQADWRVPLLLGIGLRLLLMPITWHNDAVWAPWMAHLAYDGSVNIYRTLYERFGPTVLSPVVWAPYLPMYYGFTALWTGLIKWLGFIDVGTWSFGYTGWMIERFPRAVFLMKVPYLVVDLCIWAAILMSIEPAQRRRFSWLYLFFPSQLWVSFVMGQNDTLPTLFVVLALCFAVHSMRSARSVWSWLSVACLGIGAAFKLYPLFFLLPTAILLGTSILQMAMLLAVGVTPFILAILPFLGTPSFVAGALFNQEGMSLLSVGFGEGYQRSPLFLVAYGMLSLCLLFCEVKRTGRTLRLVYLAVSAMVFVFVSWPFNWLVWLVPFLAWTVVEDDLPDVLFAAIGVYFVVLLTGWGKVAGGYSFYPLGQIWRHMAGFRDTLPSGIDFLKLQNVFSAGFVVSLVAVLLLAVLRPVRRGGLMPDLHVWSALGPSFALLGMVAFSVWMGRHEAVIRDQRAIDGPPLVLTSGGTVEQSLEMDVDGFSAVEVWISDAPSDSSEGTLALTGWSGAVQFEPVKVSGTQLESSKMNRLSFDRTYPAGVYTILLQWDGAQPVILGRSQSDVLPQGELVVNGQSTSQDLAFRTIAHLDWSRMLTEALGRFADDSVFAVFWLLSLLSTLVLSAGPCVLVFLKSRLTRGRTE